MSEDELLSAVLELAQAAGWRCYHQRPARMAKKDGEKQRWATALQGDAGFPDLVMVKGGRILIRELKSEIGNPSIEQTKWLNAFGWANVSTGIWRPADWQDGTVAKALGCENGIIQR